MRSRPPSDPRSWFFQGAIHAVNDRLLAEALLVDPKVTQVDQQKFWNRCPHFGANSAEFLLWHRAYLYYFERILRDAAQAPDLALPYWDYSNPDPEAIDPDPRLFPSIFALQFVDAPANRIPNPLYHVNREAAFTSGRYLLSSAAVDVRDTMSQSTFFGATEVDGFAGGIGDTEPGTQGFVERRPHNQIHFAVGGVIGDSAGAMADVPTAAFDPIFWVHHSNIDRLWAEWSCREGRTWGALPSRQWFDERPWFFHDYDLSVKNEPRAKYIDHQALQTEYAGASFGCKPLSLPIPSGGAIASAVAPSGETPVSYTEVRTFEAKIEASPSQSGLFAIPTRGDAAIAPEAMTPLQMRRGQERVILQLQDLHYALPPSAGFDLYINLAPGELPARQPGKFFGTLALFGLSHHPQNHTIQSQGQIFDITAAAPNGVWPEKLVVQIIPFDLLTPRGNASPFRRSESITIGRLRLLRASSQ